MKKSIFLLLTILPATTLFGQWQNNGIAVGTGSNNQWKCEIAAGTVGDAYLAWSDATVATNDYNIHISRLRSDGFIQWTQIICSATGNQETPQVVEDDSGGVIVVWHDERGGVSNYSVYAQRIDSTGVVQWTANGVQVSNVISSSMTKPRVLKDGYGGVFVVFHNQTDVYAQNISANGAQLWGASGVNLSAGITSTAQDDPELCSDGNYGIIISWENNGNIQAQHINSSGVEQWGTSGIGIPVCSAANTQDIPNIISDGNNGAIIAWEDDRNGTTATGIFAQRVSSTGMPAWTLNGVQIGETGADCRWRAPNTDGHNNSHIVADGTGNFYFVYEIYVSLITDYSVIGRRINGTNGSSLGLFSVSTSQVGDETEARAVSDGNGKVIITWDLQDTVSSVIHHIRTVTVDQSLNKTYDLYVADGNVVGGGDRRLPAVCVSGCFAIYGWHDSRGTGTWDAYASSSQILNAPIGTVPSSPSPINGPSSICSNATSQTYSCATVTGATYYSWTFPFGWVIQSGQGTSVVIISTVGISGTISVAALNGCGMSTPATLNVTVNAAPTVFITNTPASCPTCCDGTATVIPSGNSPYSYSWSTIPIQNTPTATGLCAQCYSITITDANGCQITDTTCISFTIGINEPGNTDGFSIYPNPARGWVMLKGVEASGEVTIYNAIGEQVFASVITHPSSVIDVSKLSEGIYFIRVKQGDKIITRKLIIE